MGKAIDNGEAIIVMKDFGDKEKVEQSASFWLLSLPGKKFLN